MFYNFRFFGRFLLFAIFVTSTYNGIIILKNKCFTSPFDRSRFIEGKKATIAGFLLIILGLSSLMGLLIIPFGQIWG